MAPYTGCTDLYFMTIHDHLSFFVLRSFLRGALLYLYIRCFSPPSSLIPLCAGTTSIRSLCPPSYLWSLVCTLLLPLALGCLCCN
ncbi:hypothetical protein OF83DRAFT_374057 [Amylostereum chailletii]|nr:hypothetical protein OF83DRAFT_374057 [Amylostereum chailletii]